MLKIKFNTDNSEGTSYFLIDLDDFEKIVKFRWYLTRQGYVGRMNSRKEKVRNVILMHRFLLEVKDNNKEVDHINGNKLDNRKCNLRLCSRMQNSANKTKYKNNTSGFKGVTYDKTRCKWIAGIKYNYKRINLGRFDTAVEAAIAYNKKAVELFGKFARLNEI